MRGEGVDGLEAYAVEAHALLEGFAVVLASGVEHRHGLDEFAKGYAAAVVAHGHAHVVVDIYFDALARVHLEFVDGVVDDLFQQHVDAVLGMSAIAQSADVHAGACAHVLHVGEVAYLVFAVSNLRCFLCPSLLGEGYLFFCHALCCLNR